MAYRNPFTLALLLCTLLPFAALAQEDTIRVETLTFDSITTRRGVWVFPDDTHTYRKVLMHHTLKCSPLTTQDQYNCGEWDYLTYSFVYDHTGVLDSNALTHPAYLVGAQAPSSVEALSTQLWDTQLYEVNRRTVLSTQNEDTYVLGMGNDTEAGVLSANAGTTRSQYLITGSELMATGMMAGDIEQLRLTAASAGAAPLDRLTVRMKATTSTQLSVFHETGFELVYDDQPGLLGQDAGVHSLVLVEPFSWDGSSSVIIDLAATRAASGTTSSLVGTDAGPDRGIQVTGTDGHVLLNNDHIALDPGPAATLSDAITVTFWAYGDASLPVNTSAFEALDADGRRILNVHLPWSNGSVYWDAGDDGSGYDRINKAANTADIKGQWNHWAFVKNAGIGQMKIYLNGNLWHSGSGMLRTMEGITRFRIGSAGNGNNPYRGRIDEFNVFAAEVDGATIAAWRSREVDATHPFASDLLYSLHFNEAAASFTADNEVNAAAPGWLMGTIHRRKRPATERNMNVQNVTVRPDITFVQGDFTTQMDPAQLSEQLPQSTLTREIFAVQGNATASVDTVFSWPGGWSYTYAPDGSAV
ncbi:MAG: LamG domain-containing protein, partial [Flavobacteriales bacterium]|nr:LamG domain-containing protein [Flavobacteriales bacterium]